MTRSYSDTEIVNMRRRLCAGETSSDVAAEFNTSRQYVNLVKYNKIRWGIGPDASQVVAIPHARRAEAIQMRKAGMEVKDIAERMCLSVVTVRNYTRVVGFLHGNRVLDEAKELAVWDRYSKGDITYRQLASLFYVSAATIRNAIQRVYRQKQRELQEQRRL